ncbi:hypothetical protein BC835DRAFT_979145 [Cytidiella melzeri]|nr:hypothetical protein BC835DRAFT_979145 [Cytidiella melzeri]
MPPPVGAYPHDEEILVQALCDSEDKGETYRKALEGLHGVHEHLASQWKDYYLDNAQRLNKRIEFVRSQRRDKPLIAVKKPTFDTSAKHNGSSPPPHKLTQTAYRDRSLSTHKRSSEPAVAGPSSVTGQGKAKGVGSARRSPTPPHYDPVQEMKGGKNRFTDQDRAYLVRYARYRYSLDPSVTKSAICKDLGTKAPHHTASSWLTHWAQRREDFDRKLPQFRAPLDVAAVDDGELHTDVSELESEDDEDAKSDPEGDTQNMGISGGSVTKADKRIIARYAASFGREWATMRGNERWDPFEAMYPQRKAKSWQETYRRFEKDIEKMSKKYRRRKLAESKTQQIGRPSWASRHAEEPSAKRARSRETDDEEDDDYSPSKRAK